MRTLCILTLALLVAAASPGRADARQNEPWRLAAEERIEEHRMGTLRIVVRDDAGQPVPNAEVHVAMQRHAFGFGTAVASGMMNNNQIPQYRDRLQDLTGDGRTFNMAVFENAMKWPQWESNTNKQRIVTQVLYLRSRGMDVRGHNLVWPSWQWLPNDLEEHADDPAYIRDRVEDRIRDMAGYRGIEGQMRDWDVLNEPVHLTDLRDVFRGTPGYPTGEEIYAEWFDLAAEADPDAHLWVNEYNILNNYNNTWQAETRRAYRGVIQDLLDAGAPLYGIGMQGHMSQPLTSPENLYRVFEEFAAFGLPISITEYDASNVPEAAAADYMRDFLTVAFSHPAVESFLMWGFWDGSHWRGDAPLFRQDWSLKPSGEVFLDLVFDQWWTDETVTTNAEGVAEVRAFLGEYDVSAELPGGPLTRELTLSDPGTTELVLSRSATPAEAAGTLPASVALAANYPNPFNPSTTLRYGLPAAGPVRLVVYDALGRPVARLVDGAQPAGWHEVSFEAGTLPSGTYFYRLTAGGVTLTGSMLLAK